MQCRSRDETTVDESIDVGGFDKPFLFTERSQMVRLKCSAVGELLCSLGLAVILGANSLALYTPRVAMAQEGATGNCTRDPDTGICANLTCTGNCPMKVGCPCQE